MTDFDVTYKKVVDLLKQRLDDKDAAVPEFESGRIAPFCFIGLPRDLILGIDDDRLFLQSTYFKVLDATIDPEELDNLVRDLASGALTREQVIVDLQTADDGFERSVRMEWV